MIVKDLINYWINSKNKKLYKQLGESYRVSGFHVYRLAHGKAVSYAIDSEILNKLIEKGIISGTRTHI